MARNSEGQDDPEREFEQLIPLIFEVATSAARHRGAKQFEADEVAQLTALKLWRSWDQAAVRTIRELDEGDARWRAYIWRIAVNTHIDQVRSHQRRLARNQAAFEVQTGVPASRASNWAISAIDAWLARDAIATQILKLPTRQRQVAARLFLEERSVNEVATELAIDPQTIRKHARAARETLRLTILDGQWEQI